MSQAKYQAASLEIHGQIGVIRLNRSNSLNAFNEALYTDVLNALRELDEHPDTVITVLTGTGRFFSSGADVKAGVQIPPPESTAVDKKLFYLAKFARALELSRSMIDHKKVLVLALNGPGIGGGAAWFQGVADIVVAAEGAYLQVPFNALGLVPENGSAPIFSQSIGVRRANDLLMLGRKCSVSELESWGLVNRIFPATDFHAHVLEFLNQQLAVNDGGSLMETRRLQNAPLRKDRLFAVYDSVDALAERFVDGAPLGRFGKKKDQIGKNRAKL